MSSTLVVLVRENSPGMLAAEVGQTRVWSFAFSSSISSLRSTILQRPFDCDDCWCPDLRHWTLVSPVRQKPSVTLVVEVEQILWEVCLEKPDLISVSTWKPLAGRCSDRMRISLVAEVDHRPHTSRFQPPTPLESDWCTNHRAPRRFPRRFRSHRRCIPPW